MKKFLTLAAFFAAVAMASYGGNTLLAHAQTATALQQQLDDAKAELVQLQMQAGEVPTGDAGAPTQPAQPLAVATPSAPTVTLSAAEITEMSSALTALANLLETVQAKAAQDPQFISSDGPVVVSALQNISQTIAAIGTEMTGSNVAMITPTPSTPVAVSAPTTGSTAASNPTSIAQSAPSAVATQPSQISPTTPSAPVAALSTLPPQVAQASSAFSLSKLNWPLIIVIILVVAAIAIWLWWDDGDEKKQPVVKTVTTVPQRPTQQAQPMPLQTTTQVTVNSTSQGQNGNRQPSAAPQTPLSSAVAPHANR